MSHSHVRQAGLVAAAVALTGLAAPSALAAPGYGDYDATVKVWNCSASLVRLPGAADTDKALVLTNGHCLPSGHLDGSQVLVNQKYHPDYADATILKGNQGSAKVVRTVKLEQVAYATMKSTDVALIRTNTTYRQLASAGIKARPLAATQPAVGTVVDVPSTYWNQVHRGCGIQAVVPTLQEGVWTWQDSMRLGSQCNDLPGGTSGSPMVDQSTGAVVGVVNTVQTDSGDCSENNPCEDTGAAPAGTSYGQQTWWAAGCFKNSVWSPTSQCRLPRP